MVVVPLSAFRLWRAVPEMCGIAGIFHMDGATPDDGNALEAMQRSLVHRGPDGHGSFVRGSVRLTMRRLSIIDVEGGVQPINNETDTVHVVLNGEIYNFQRLRETLEAHGHRFRTHSDTETIVHAYEEWGDAFVDRLDGMFALAVWDESRQRLLLARDRAGIKPLYFATAGSTLVFGSELKAVLASGYVGRDLDYQVLAHYLALEYVPAPSSILQSVKRLEAGCTLVASTSGVQTSRYWDLDLSQSENNPVQGSIAEHAGTFYEVLRGAVKREMVSDVPVGVLLSGGLDSSAVALLMSEVSNHQVPSFSVSFSESSYDESRYARQVADHVGTKHYELPMRPDDLINTLPVLAGNIDEPFADPSIIPTYLISRFAREHVKVVLGGDGGDEMLAGYSTLQAHRIAPVYRSLPVWIRRGIVEPFVSRMPVSSRYLALDFLLGRFIRGADVPPYLQHQMWTGSHYGEDLTAILHPDIRSEIDDSCFHQMLADVSGRSGARHPLNRVLYQDFKLYMEGDILTKVDRASMATSLETRVPFLNVEVMTYLQKIPIDWKLRGFTRKYLLRKAMEGRLPASIIGRRKRGFSIPIAAWLNRELQPLVREYLAEERLDREGIFCGSEVSRLLDQHSRYVSNHAKRIWTILMFQLWRDRWMENV